MRTVQRLLPESVDLSAEDIKFILAARLYETAQLSLGQAAEVAEMTKRTFIEMLGRYGVSVFNQSPDSLADDLKHA